MDCSSSFGPGGLDLFDLLKQYSKCKDLQFFKRLKLWQCLVEGFGEDPGDEI